MRVASYLDFQDVWVSRRVCQKWKQIFMACKELWRDVRIDLPDAPFPPAFGNIIALSSPCRLALRIHGISPLHDHVRDVLVILRESMCRIHTLHLAFEGGVDEAVENLLDELDAPAPLLRRFTLTCGDDLPTGWFPNPLGAPLFNGEAPNLEHLALDRNFSFYTIGGPQGPLDPAIVAPPVVLSNITTLVLDSDESTIQELGDTFPGVRSLHLIGPWSNIRMSPDSHPIWSRLERFSITANMLPNGLRDNNANVDEWPGDAMDLTAFVISQGVRDVSLHINKALYAAVKLLAECVPRPTQIYVGRGGYDYGLHGNWSGLGFDCGITYGVFVEFSTEIVTMRVGDSSDDRRHGLSMTRAIEFSHLACLTRLTLCESVVPELTSLWASIRIPLLTTLALLIAARRDRRTSELFDVYVDHTIGWVRGTSRPGFFIDAPKLATLELSGTPPGAAWTSALVDIRGCSKSIKDTDEVREVSAASLGRFIYQHLRFANTPPLEIVLTAPSVAFSEGFTKGQEALVAYIVRYR